MRRFRGWLAALMGGYLLFYAILFAETSYILPRLYARGYADLPAERFRAEWLRVALQIAPLRWLACESCQRYGRLGLTILPAAVLLLALGYLGALRAVQRRPEEWSLRRLLGLAALAALPLAFLLPSTSGDYVAYIFTGRMLSVYHASPWRHVLAEFPAEQQYLSPTAWGASLQCIYGPVWAIVPAITTGVAHRLMPGDLTFTSLVLNVLLLRGANALALAAAGAAVWRINGRLWPRQQPLVTAAFMLNPLLVYEAIGALHNDIWGVVFMLWSCEQFLRDESRTAPVPPFLAPLALSFLTKFAVAAMVPFLGVYHWRRRDWCRLGWVAATLLICAGLTQITAMDHLTRRIDVLRTHFMLSPVSVAQFAGALPVTLGWLPALTGSLVNAISHGLALLLLPIFGILLWRTRTREQVIVHTLWVMALYLAGVYLDTMAWYYVWPLALLCAIRWSRATLNVVWASSFMLLGYGVQLWNHAGLNGWGAWTLVPGFLLSMGLPALFCLAGWCGWSVLRPASPPAHPRIDLGESPSPAARVPDLMLPIHRVIRSGTRAAGDGHHPINRGGLCSLLERLSGRG
jgi:hypothetical protein